MTQEHTTLIHALPTHCDSIYIGKANCTTRKWWSILKQNDAAPRLSESLAPLLLIHSALHPTASRFSSTLLRPLPLGHAPKSSLPLPLTKPPAQSNQRHLTLGCCTTWRKTKMFWWPRLGVLLCCAAWILLWRNRFDPPVRTLGV